MQRRHITVRGIVQGVGFRPFVHSLARRFDLAGFVRNVAGRVEIEVQGPVEALDPFFSALAAEAPRLARLDAIAWDAVALREENTFQIEPSRAESAGEVVLPADVATCDDCLAELFDPRNRRYRYPFINCTACGPRLTIITGTPYDRPRTTMARFTMCPACLAEYEDPSNRRFHAQPIACPVCGPRLELSNAEGQPVACVDPLIEFAQSLLAGKIGALKGLGGYHLACLADEPVVADLRRRKHREEKPFAVMVADVATAEQLCELSTAERELLTSPRRPIVLLRRRAGAAVADAIAPGNPLLGVMLPYTPLHHLLMAQVVGRPLVMTSGNPSDEPIATAEPEVFAALAGIADCYLTHDRPIHV